MPLNDLVGNVRLKEGLFQQQRGRGFSHAYIIAGQDGIGKHTLARYLAAMMLCQHPKERPPCRSCASCRKVSNGIHPDVISICGANGKAIAVEQIRGLHSDAYIRPNEGERKIYLLEQAGEMKSSAQNAMLKLLEEGPSYATFLLLCHQSGELLPTIRSRCEVLELSPLSVAECEQWLKQHYSGESEAKIHQVAKECQGILGRAVEWMECAEQGHQDILRQSRRLAQALEEGQEEQLFEETLRLDKMSREELAMLLEMLEEELVHQLPCSKKRNQILHAVELVKQLQDAVEYHVSSGQISGWLCAGMFI